MRKAGSTALAVVVLLIGALALSATASAAPQLSTGKARTVAKAWVKKRALAFDNNNNDHGTPSNWGVVTADNCERTNRTTVECAYGMFWADGHRVFGIARVHATGFRKGAPVGISVANGAPQAVDDEGTNNGGSSTPGTATDIDPSGTGPLDSGDDQGGDAG
jgi:hypothetical protein